MADTDIRKLLMDRLGQGGGEEAPAEEAAPPEAEAADPMLDGANDLIAAVEAQDPAGIAEAFRTMFQALQMEPRMEAEQG